MIFSATDRGLFCAMSMPSLRVLHESGEDVEPLLASNVQAHISNCMFFFFILKTIDTLDSHQGHQNDK